MGVQRQTELSVFKIDSSRLLLSMQDCNDGKDAHPALTNYQLVASFRSLSPTPALTQIKRLKIVNFDVQMSLLFATVFPCSYQPVPKVCYTLRFVLSKQYQTHVQGLCADGDYVEVNYILGLFWSSQFQCMHYLLTIFSCSVICRVPNSGEVIITIINLLGCRAPSLSSFHG